MRGRFAAHAKVVRRAHDAASEQMRPQLIHQHAPRERIGRIDQPASQVEPIGRAGAARFERGERRQRARLHFVFRIEKIAAIQPVTGARILGPLADHADRHHRLGRHAVFQLLDFGHQLAGSFESLDVELHEHRALFVRALFGRYPQHVADILRNAQQRVVAGNGHHAKPTHGVLLAVILTEHELQPGGRLGFDLLLGKDHHLVVAARLSADGPTGFLVAVDRTLGGKVLLAVVGFGMLELQPVVALELFGGSGKDAQLAQHEIPLLGPPGSATAERIVREHFNTKTGDPFQLALGRDRQFVDVRVLAGHQVRAVGEQLELGAGLRLDAYQLHGMKLERDRFG